jgi:L-aspartate oxidase
MNRFPNIYRESLKRGFDLTKHPIPVTPAAHFLCGGIATDLYGRTSIKNLFSYGETAATGVHGANRLASNSLLEGMVFPTQIKHCIEELPKTPYVISRHESPKQSQTRLSRFARNNNDQISIPYALTSITKEIRQIMWLYVGIVRTPKGLVLACEKLKKIKKKLEKFDGANQQLLETKNMLTVALLIAETAQKRKKSLGTHFIQN